jgi:predicted nucleotidyltransferase
VETLETIKKKLSLLKPILIQKYHVHTIGLFGSILRSDFNKSSDIDIIVDFSAPIGHEFIDLADYIEDQLKTPVDLVSKKGIKEKYFKSIQSDIQYV